ncbi:MULTISPECIES: recombinase family protein [Bacillus]|uniref:Integrase n=2 Tax=Bacillus cereus group TaxID=86661 RepID=A0A2C1DQ84_BACCE|nr:MULTISPECIES: recombinase family protein [Bacillus cereus group]OFD69942.1 hypothetical protein BWGOE8_58630 [Bacillus mycoides]OFD70301.1 hypothetical protein BWGOE9_56610 [Bacillus mycoides]OFD70579.1 hypothetical protein BWGOE10_57680 [Bacillus mycoides]PGT02587.1 integrase [Bacillus cereus]
MNFGYIRISSKQQNEKRQIESLLEKGILKENIYIDKQSGKNFDRPAYQELKSKVQPGDTIYFHEIDRFARNFAEGKEEVDFYSRMSVQLIFLDMEYLNSMMTHDDVITRAFGHMQVLMHLAIAEKEREKMKKRQDEGIALAQKSGVKFGRPKVYGDSGTKLQKAIDMYLNREANVPQITAITGISKTTLYRRMKELGIKRED